MGTVKEVTDATFNETVTGAAGAVLVDYWAPWCGPCKMISPTLEQLAANSKNLTFAKLNVDDNPRSAANAGVTSIPMLVVYKEGKAVKTIIGAKPKAALEAELAEYL